MTEYSVEKRPTIKYSESYPSPKKPEYNVFINDEGYDGRTSTETYASTVASEEDLLDQPEYELPDQRYRVFETDARPTSAPEFARLFPTCDRLLIQHDDSTSDGNMNLRVDTECLARGQKVKMTLFHLRMKNLHERQFSLRRYCRESGREVCNSKKKYVKPTPKSQPQKKPSLTRGWMSYTGSKSSGNRRSRDSGYESDEDRELEEELRNFTLNSEVKATIPTNIIRLEYSNYAQVELHKRRRGNTRSMDFEYWGDQYTWQRQQQTDEEDGEIIYFYELMCNRTGDCVAYIMPDKLDAVQSRLEASQGGWVPPCTMRLTKEDISDDLGDVIVATGLITLVDDCIKRRWHSSHAARVLVPNHSDEGFVEPERIVDEVFPRKQARKSGRS
jgi:hypothetical protein